MGVQASITRNPLEKWWVGQKVMCHGYKGIITKIHNGQLTGLVDVRLERGPICVDVCDIKIQSTNRYTDASIKGES